MKKQSFFLSSMILIIMVVVTKILGLIYKIPLTNLLGGLGYGYYSVAYSVFMPVFSVAVSGISTAIATKVSENMAFERYKNVRKIRRVSLIYFTLGGIAFTILAIIIAYPVCLYLVKEPQAMWSVVAISPCIFIGCVLAVERGYYEGLRNMTPTAVSEIIESLFKIFLGLGLGIWATHHSDSFFIKGLPFISAMCVLGVTMANLISLVILEIMRVFMKDSISKTMLESDPSTDRMRAILKDILAVSNPIAIASCISTLGGFIDTITINHCLKKIVKSSPEVLSAKLGLSVELLEIPNFIYGSYTGLALTIFGLIPSLTSIFGKSILPIISEEYARGKFFSVSEKINSVLLITSVIALPSAMGIYTFSDEILQILFPSKQVEIVAISQSLKILCSGMIFLCMATPLFSIIQAISKPKVGIKIMLVSSVVRMILNFYLVSQPQLNIAGASISTTISYGVIFIWSVWELTKTSRVKISYKKVFVKPFFSGFFCVKTAEIFYNLMILKVSGLISLIFSIILSVILYIFSLRVLDIITKNELKSQFFK